MQNVGTDFIKRILKDKVRLRRWKKRLLCLSCVVVFCTVYALILPALTLESKTVCGQKEHVHTEACCSEKGQLICGMAEHVHTEACFAKDSSPTDALQENPDESLASGTTAGDTKADGVENTGSGAAGVSGTEGADSGDIVESGTGDAGSGDIGESGTEGTDSGDTGVSGTEGTGSGDIGESGTESTDIGQNGTIDAGTGSGKTEIAGEASDMEERIGLLAEDEDEGDEAAVSPEAAASAGLDLSATTNSQYVDEIKLYYKDSTDAWQQLKPSENPVIPADSGIKLDIWYKDIPISKLMKDYGSTLTYSIPVHLRNMTANGSIMDGSTKVGTVTVEDGKLVVRFEASYLQKQLDAKQTTISGNFYAEGEIVLKDADEKGKITVSTAGKQFELNVGQDAVAQYGKVTVDKTCQSTNVIVGADGSYYIAYNIKVTAGADGCPDVSVVDTLTSGSERVDSYAEISTTATALKASPSGQQPYETIVGGTTATTHGSIYYGTIPADDSIPTPDTAGSAPGSLVWKPGNLAPNESRTLTYYVKLKDKVPLNTGAIQNNAKVFSKTYKRVEDHASFEPKIDYKMQKRGVGGVVRNADGTYTIRYEIEFTLKNSNYPLKDFSFIDRLNYTDQFHTDSAALPYIGYDTDSIELYKKGSGEADYTKIDEAKYTTSWTSDGNTYRTDWTETDSTPNGFKITGTTENPITVNPGDSYYATYTMTVKPEALAAVQADKLNVINRYLTWASNARNEMDNAFLNKVYNNEFKVGDYNWVDKEVKTGTTTDETVPMEGDRYNYNRDSHSVTKETEPAASFTVPAGSYQYIVNVNQTFEEWDATQVAITDTLKSDKMRYTGYVKVEACKYDAASNDYVAKETKWVKVDGLQSFTLKPSDLGWTGENYAYKLTYYAKPIDNTFSSTTVTNRVELNGTVQKDGNVFPVNGISKETTITVSGNFKMDVKKTAWYYDDPKEEATTWKNGKLYWAIEVSGTAILENTCFQDYISKDTGLQDSFLHSDSLAGIYRGKLPDSKTLADYKSLEELKKAGLTDVKDKFTSPSFENSKSFPDTDNYSELTVQAKERISLGEEGNLYIIICSEPQSLPAYRGDYTYRNHIKTSDNGTAWTEQNSADAHLYGGADILKELGQTFTYDGTKVESSRDGRDEGDSSKIAKELLKSPGQYASWVFKVNYAGNMSGTYRVLENIPKGMELAYIRIKWVGTKQNFADMNAKEITGLNSEWEKKQVVAATDNGSSKTTTYYVKGNQALIELGNFKAGKERDNYSVDVQVVCRVTDKEILLGGQTKNFENKVTLQKSNGKEITTATAPAEIPPQKIEKSFEANNETITFTIKANQLGQALPTVAGTKLKLIDKLSPSLRLDTTSIKVVNSQNAAEDLTDQCKASLPEDNTLEIEIPHDKPVTITYNAMINAPPKTEVSFSNTVYWETYTPAEGTKVEQSKYTYEAGGSVSTGTSITLKIIKMDQNNLTKKLSGAEFKVVECVRDKTTGEITVKTDSKEWTGTTGVDGTVTLGTGTQSGFVMKYNTIYKVTETKAPDGYVLESKEIYIMVPKKDNDATDYSDEVKACIKDPVIQKQYESTFQLSVSNQRGEINVTKAFKNAGSGDASPVSGSYKFGLYENEDGTNGSGPSGKSEEPLQTVTITYNAGETETKTAKFVDLELDKTYYVFELDDEGKPIKDPAAVAVVNGMEYFTSYKTNTASSSVSNSAVSGDTVTVTNQSRVKELPSTGGYGVLIYRLAGAICIFFAGLLLLKNKLQQK